MSQLVPLVNVFVIKVVPAPYLTFLVPEKEQYPPSVAQYVYPDGAGVGVVVGVGLGVGVGVGVGVGTAVDLR